MEDKKVKIIMFGRGFVVSAYEEDMKIIRMGEVDWWRVEKATTIRDWGCSNGIGELVKGGPTSKTILDAIPHSLQIPVGAVHMMLDVLPGKATDGFVAQMKKAMLKLV